ncbi:MAG TPA: MerR family transcriptional regulator, partial [Acidobacteriota bacterium]|nr:MerR family transcriptional regulator [Acidobacteriota bacterium]
MAKNRRKLFYKIGEVARICEVEPHVLRYWETVFPRLRPA